MNNLWKTFVGDRNFYRRVLMVAVPIILQNGITNFVGLLDNIMVGRIGTEPMSGVAIVNQLLFVFNLCVFGGLSGVGIFTSQFYGSGDEEGIRNTVRFKFWIGGVILLVSFLILSQGGTVLIGTYLNGSSSEGGDLALTLIYAQKYLRIMLIYLLPFLLAQIYSQTLRECGETLIPMVAGIIAVFINLGLNYILIYGKLGMPAMGVEGAALATVIARIIEMLIVMIWAHGHTERLPFIHGLFRTFYVPGALVRRLIITGTPLLINETLWAAGMAMLVQCYSVRGLTVVAGFNIATTISNVFNTIYIAMGSAIAILVGQSLGSGDMKQTKDLDNKLIAFSVVVSLLISLMLVLTAPVFPRLYNTSSEVRQIAARLMLLTAIFVPQNAFINAAYFTIRSGGKTFITFLFDSVFVCLVCVPVAFVLSRFTDWSVFRIYVMVQLTDLIKCGIGMALVVKDVWLVNIVDEFASE